ncbi:MarR family winged helix-turn-helix transcriptional regulator [Mucilaginibacter ximonensis]|uniref:MarR family winged helix-turn-helix transcriptional regulator n=1 Tax=Mucilaginibacter ximonensis TaxID=538021 RepID=A0ABW5YCM7_9SPHI
MENLEFVSELRTTVGRLIKKLRKESSTAELLSLTERSTMGLLYQNKSMLPSELAASEKITNQSMSDILKHLLDLGFITRTASEQDKRKVHISLSAEGEKTLLQMRNERDQWLTQAITATCNAHEQELLKKSISILTKIVEFE